MSSIEVALDLNGTTIQLSARTPAAVLEAAPRVLLLLNVEGLRLIADWTDYVTEELWLSSEQPDLTVVGVVAVWLACKLIDVDYPDSIDDANDAHLVAQVIMAAPRVGCVTPKYSDGRSVVVGDWVLSPNHADWGNVTALTGNLISVFWHGSETPGEHQGAESLTWYETEAEVGAAAFDGALERRQAEDGLYRAIFDAATEGAVDNWAEVEEVHDDLNVQVAYATLLVGQGRDQQRHTLNHEALVRGARALAQWNNSQGRRMGEMLQDPHTADWEVGDLADYIVQLGLFGEVLHA